LFCNAETVLDAARFCHGRLFHAICNEYDTPVHSNRDVCRLPRYRQSLRSPPREGHILCETELKLLCLMRAWFLTYYDRSSATYEKCRNVLDSRTSSEGEPSSLNRCGRSMFPSQSLSIPLWLKIKLTCGRQTNSTTGSQVRCIACRIGPCAERQRLNSSAGTKRSSDHLVE
jgi:hypothetical protein